MPGKKGRVTYLPPVVTEPRAVTDGYRPQRAPAGLMAVGHRAYNFFTGLAIAGLLAGRGEAMAFDGVRITWLGHSTFRIETPGGKTVLIDPWVMNNPACPAGEKQIKKVDIILATHGHFDHIGDAVEIAAKHNPVVVGIFELCHWLQSKGVKQTAPMNKGGTQEVSGLKITMTHAVHSCGILDGGQIIYGGEACGYVIEFENGLRLYHAGDTAVFGDMHIIRELYAPELVMLPMGDHFTMSPEEAIYAVQLLRPKAVIPMHFGTFPLLKGTPAQFRELLSAVGGVELIELIPGEQYSWAGGEWPTAARQVPVVGRP